MYIYIYIYIYRATQTNLMKSFGVLDGYWGSVGENNVLAELEPICLYAKPQNNYFSFSKLFTFCGDSELQWFIFWRFMFFHC
jgi:hypothetical protein